MHVLFSDVFRRVWGVSPSVPSLAADPSGAEETRSAVPRVLQPRAGADHGPRRALRMWKPDIPILASQAFTVII